MRPSTDESARRPEASGRLAGKRALVTGAASGIGRAIAQSFAAEGAALALLDIDADQAARVAQDCGALSFPCDVAQPEMAAGAMGDAVDALGGLDIVVNAAGVLIMRAFEAMAPDEWSRMFDVNLRGPALICQAALPALRRSERASIINISSLAALKPSPQMAAYSASKAGLLMLTKCLATELAPIRVNAICPGIVASAMTQAILSDTAMKTRIQAANVLRMIGQPEDIAAAALFLASDEARFVTGTQIVIDGGSSFS